MIESALAAEGVAYNERLYTPLVTTWLFLSQVLDPDHPCRAAVPPLQGEDQDHPAIQLGP